MRIMCERVGIYRRNNNNNITSNRPANNRVNDDRRCTAEDVVQDVAEAAAAAAAEEILATVSVVRHPPRVLEWLKNALLDAPKKTQDSLATRNTSSSSSSSDRGHGRYCVLSTCSGRGW